MIPHHKSLGSVNPVSIGLAIFATKMGDTYSRVWVGAWLLGGYVATAAFRVVVRSLVWRPKVRICANSHAIWSSGCAR